jgi:lysophospholipase L1-like esterase
VVVVIPRPAHARLALFVWFAFCCAAASAQGPPQRVAPAPRSTAVFFGDSITYGRGASACSRSGLAPTGTCWTDRVARRYDLYEVNKGTGSQLLETCAIAADCLGIPSALESYPTAILPYCGANANNVFIAFGTNDATMMVRNGPQATGTESFTGATFATALTTIVKACEAAGTPPKQIWILSTPLENAALTGWLAPHAASFQAFLAAFNSASARAAAAAGANFVSVSKYEANYVYDPQPIWDDDGIHPSDYGHELVANAVGAGAGGPHE